ncbi:hypothetical protein LCGC14_0273470 [marine sediment metagenome]|uniref:HNH endonuclease n=2 Tax=root TaxID=1 RepID=A0A9C9NK12_9HYPH|nr:hypothetical protein [Aurantimonas coralicida]
MAAITELRERWAPVAGFGGFYEVSDRGQVRSHHRGGRPLRIIYRKRDDRPYVNLCAHGERKLRAVYHLVLEAFVGPCPDGLEACHEDGDVRNNCLQNLRWDTKAANEADKLRHGTRSRGERHGMSKLEPQDVKIIRSQQPQDWSAAKELGEAFGVDPGTILHIWSRKTWRHI